MSKDVVLCFKMTRAEREAIDTLVKVRGEEVSKLAGQRINFTAGAYLRWLVARDAEARGIPIGAEAAGALGATPGGEG